MTALDTFNAFFDDVMNRKMSIYAFGMYAKGCITLLELEYQQLKDESETTNGDLTALIHRAFLIMNDEKFFECGEDGAWHSSLHTTMTKVITNRKFTDRYTMQNIVIEGMKNKIKELESIPSNVCNWKRDDPEYNTYKTGCGEMQQFMEGDISDNHYKHCPYCGKEIKEVRP